MNKLQDDVFQKIIASAADLFVAGTISGTSIRDIANAAGCGEATIYRHYKTKDQLAVQAAELIAGQMQERYFIYDPALNGGERVRAFFEAYEKIYHINPGYYRFLFELDSMFLSKASAETKSYENTVDAFYHIFSDAYDQGLREGSVRAVENVELFYYSSAHALLSLCKTLAVSATPFSHDKLIRPETEIHTLTELILKNII